jgi:excisionase family DNA binding protein
MLYDQKEAAKFLNVCVRTVERARKAGQLNCRLIGKAIRFTQGDLDEFILKSSVQPLTEEKTCKTIGIWEVRNDTHTA